jgi:hypothetical protein
MGVNAPPPAAGLERSVTPGSVKLPVKYFRKRFPTGSVPVSGALMTSLILALATAISKAEHPALSLTPSRRRTPGCQMALWRLGCDVAVA